MSQQLLRDRETVTPRTAVPRPAMQHALWWETSGINQKNPQILQPSRIYQLTVRTGGLFFPFGGRVKARQPLARGRQVLWLSWHSMRLFHTFLSLPPCGSASSSLTSMPHGICWATSFSAAYVQRAFHQPGSSLLTYKELSVSPHVFFAIVEPPLSS